MGGGGRLSFFAASHMEETNMYDEVWKDIPGYEGFYSISNQGRVYSHITGKCRSDVKSGYGYRAIELSDFQHKKHRFYIHRLVALAFLGTPQCPDYVVNHKNLNKSDNRVENLEWVSQAENYRHAYMNGRTDFRRPIRPDNSTGVKGISRHTDGYQVELCGKYVGWYKSIEKAISARLAAERKYGNEILARGLGNIL